MYSLRMSFCTVPRSAVPGTPCCLGDELVEEQQERRRRVDRHRRRHVGERDAREQDLHVGERVDRDAGAPHLAARERIVGVVAELRRQVEGDREPRLAALEQVAVALVRLLGRGEPGVLADRPRPAAVHVAIGAARVRVLAGRLELARHVVGRVDRLDLDPTLRLAPVCRCHARSMLASAHRRCRAGRPAARRRLRVPCRGDRPRPPVRRPPRARRLGAAGDRRRQRRRGVARARPRRRAEAASSTRSTRSTRPPTTRSRTVTRSR